jgi:hypothetical protein
MEQYEKILSLVLQTAFTVLIFTIIVAIYRDCKKK